MQRIDVLFALASFATKQMDRVDRVGDAYCDEKQIGKLHIYVGFLLHTLYGSIKTAAQIHEGFLVAGEWLQGQF